MTHPEAKFLSSCEPVKLNKCREGGRETQEGGDMGMYVYV